MTVGRVSNPPSAFRPPPPVTARVLTIERVEGRW